MSTTGSTDIYSRADIYTREQIQNGEGCYTNQRTAIFERPDGRYETHDLSAIPSSFLTLAGYAHPRPGRPARVVFVCE